MKPMMLGACLAAIAGQADALSCNFGNTASAWVEAEQIGDPFITVRGTFWMRDAWRSFEEEDYVLPARFEGVIINADGTTTPLKTPVQVIGACINGDCGYVGPRVELVTFLHGSADARIAYSMPCSSYPVDTSQDTMADLLACMNGDVCTPEFAF